MSASTAGGGAAPLAVRYGNFLFRRRNAVFPAVIGALFVLLPPRPFLGDWAADRWLDLLGLLVCLSGQAFRAAVVGLAYIKRGGVDKRIFAAKLVREGMFAASRNPLYVGNLAVLAGVFLIHNNPYAYLIGGAFFLLSYRAIVAAEERYLRGQFGAGYEDYCRRVNRWWPSPGLIGPAVAGMSFNWRRLVIKEYGSFVSWVAMVLLVLAWQALAAEGWPAAASRLTGLALGLAAALALAGLVRWLKKSGRLTDPAA
ncbi:MAG: methyltransferase family protein [Rhodospirillales bacterium]